LLASHQGDSGRKTKIILIRPTIGHWKSGLASLGESTLNLNWLLTHLCIDRRLVVSGVYYFELIEGYRSEELTYDEPARKRPWCQSTFAL
jgi:hypothetical protein